MTIVFPERDCLFIEQKTNEPHAQWRKAVEVILSAAGESAAPRAGEGAVVVYRDMTFRAVRCAAAVGAFVVRAAAEGLLTRSAMAVGLEHDGAKPVLHCWTPNEHVRAAGDEVPEHLRPRVPGAGWRRLVRRARSAAAMHSAEGVVVFAAAMALLLGMVAAWRRWPPAVGQRWEMALAALLLLAWAAFVHWPVRSALRRLFPLRGVIVVVGEDGRIESVKLPAGRPS